MKLPKYFYFRIKMINHGKGVSVEDASDVDVVEIVRCKDCKHWTGENGGLCDIWDHYISNGEFFCGCGAKMGVSTEE